MRDQTISRFERIKVELIKEGAVEYENGIGVDCGDLICSRENGDIDGATGVKSADGVGAHYYPSSS